MPRQRQKSDCAVAAVARALGKSYASTKRVCGTTRGGLADHEVGWLIREMGADYCVYQPHKRMSAAEWAARNPTTKAVILLAGPLILEGTPHAVSSVDGIVECPSDGGDNPSGEVYLAFIILED